MARKTSKTKKQAEETKPEAEETAVVAEPVEDVEDTPEAEVSDPKVETEVTPEPEETEPETPVEDEKPAAPKSDTPAVAAQQSRFFPLVLGGVVAAGIGFGSALYLLPNLPAGWLPEQGEDITAALAEKLEAQNGEIEKLKAQMAETGTTDALEAGLADVSGKVDAVAADLATLKDGLDQIDALETRLSALEKAPVESASPAAVEAYQREMAELQKALAAQRAEVEAIAAEAEEKRASAEMTAQEALRRSAVSQILTSLETGSSFGDAIESLKATGVTVPDALEAQAGGVTTVAQLSADFPEVAREALAAARTAGGEAGGGFGSFLKTQLGARSLEPREGTDPDAVLSRMEAAAREGRLGDVMAEAEGLPDEAKAPLQDWIDAAKARQAALEAADALSQQMNTN